MMGSGTSTDPYLIYNEDDLNEVRNLSTANFKLMNNIYLTKFQTGIGWTPIATFSGVFDGNFHIIYNLYCNSTSSYTGMFGQLTGSATIRNLGLVDVDIYSTTNYVGGLVGYMASSTALIEKCFVTGKVVSKNGFVGGLVGLNYYGDIRDCWTEAEACGTVRVGGLIGYHSYSQSEIKNCYCSSYVDITPPTSDLMGAFIGESVNTPVYTNCYYNADSYYWDKVTAFTGLPGSDNTNSSKFVGFDFTNTWEFIDGINHPVLKGFTLTKSLIKQNNKLFTFKDQSWSETDDFIPSQNEALTFGMNEFKYLFSKKDRAKFRFKHRQSLGTGQLFRANIELDKINTTITSSLKFQSRTIGGSSLVPDMTNNTSPSGTASSSTIYDGNFQPWKAFDKVNDTSYCWATQNGLRSGWIAYEFLSPVIFEGYSIWARNSAYASTQSPKNWTFEAWDTISSSWVILDERTNETDWTTNERRNYSFKFPTGKSYSKYQLNITDNNGATALSIGELIFCNYSPVINYDHTYRSLIKKSDGTIVTFNGTNWVNTGLVEPLTENDFLTQTTYNSMKNIAYTKWNELGQKFEILTFTPEKLVKEMHVEMNVNQYNPLDFLDTNFEIVTWTNSNRDLQFQANVDADNKIRYLVSRDNRSLWHYFDGANWIDVPLANILTHGMTKTQLEAITPSQWKTWFKRHTLDFAIGIETQNPYESNRFENLTFNFPANSYPIVDTFTATPNPVTRNNVTVNLKLKDLEGDKYRYKLLINNVDYLFTTNSGWSQWIDGDLGDYSVSHIFPYSLFTVGTNNIRLIVEDDRGVTFEPPYLTVELINTLPYLSVITNDSWSFNASVNDDEGDMIRYRVLINGIQVFPTLGVGETVRYTNYITVPNNISYQWKSSDVNIGAMNTVTIEIQDKLGGIFTHNITNVLGRYKGIMFKAEDGTYYSDDMGNILNFLDFGTIVQGQVTPIAKVYLENSFGMGVDNINVKMNPPTTGYDVQLSTSDLPFITSYDLNYGSQVLNYGDSLPFYVRVVSTFGAASNGGTFEIIMKADPV